MTSSPPTKNTTVMASRLIEEFHPFKNGALRLSDLSPGSGRKVWWKCKKGHDWEATVSNRTKGSGCPCCSGRSATAENNLAVRFPEIAKQWHSKNSGTLSPGQVKPGSNKKVWWKCDRGHEWEAVVFTRTTGTGCPYCSGNLASEDNNLAVKFPTLADEWHPTRNGHLDPEQVTPGSHKKVWWKCHRGHEWEAIIANRAQGTGCPYCSGTLATRDSNFAVKFPELAEQWHPTKNEDLEPHMFNPGSGKKVWWRCHRGHEWAATIHNRTGGSGCPYCSGHKPTEDNNLAVRFPKIAEEWHPSQNQDMHPHLFSPYSHRKVWWKCSCGYEWQASIERRAFGGKCPRCKKSI